MMHTVDDRRLWAETVGTFVYTRNCQPHSTLAGKTPYEAFHKTRLVVRREPFSKSCEITQADNLNRRQRLFRKAQCFKLEVGKVIKIFLA